MQLLQQGDLIFDRYRVARFVAAGGQAFGFAGIDTRCPPDRPWERNVFLKQYHDLQLSQGALQALRERLSTLRDRLADNDHFICLPTYVGSDRNSLLMVFPEVRGKTLREWMDEGLSQKQCVRFAQAITKAVRIIHEAGVIHLDLKPDNVLIQARERNGETIYFTKIIDLDAARIDGIGLHESPMGTPLYYSPEHFAPDTAGAVSEKSDVFTLAIMVFELLFKRHPFADCEDYHDAVLNRRFKVPASKYYGNLVRMIVRGLNSDPNRRPTARDIHRVMHRYYMDGFETERAKDQWRTRPAATNGRPRKRSTRRARMSGASTGKASKGTGTPGDAISASRNREPVIFQLLNGKSKTVENSGKICGEDFDLPEQFHGPLAQVDIRPAGCHLTLLTVPIEVPSRENLTGLLGQLQSWFSPRPRISLSQPTAFLNDRPLKLSEQVRLQDADELRIGNYRFRIHMNAAAHVGSPE